MASVVPVSEDRPKRVLRVLPSQRGRFSVRKFLDFHEYAAATSTWRIAWVLATVPLPGLLAALLPGLLPLRPLHVGPTVGSYAHVFMLNAAIAWGTVVITTTLAKVPSSLYSWRDAVLVAALCGTFQAGIVSQVYRVWRFPIPFALLVGASFWVASMALAHLLVLRSRCFYKGILKQALQYNQMGSSIEMLQVFIYPSISILFDHVSEASQIALTLLFPLVKYALKLALEHATRHIHDQHDIAVVSAVEICASLYQSIIM